MIDDIQKRLLEEVADLHQMPEGAYNIRANGEMAARSTTAARSRANSLRFIPSPPGHFLLFYHNRRKIRRDI